MTAASWITFSLVAVRVRLSTSARRCETATFWKKRSIGPVAPERRQVEHHLAARARLDGGPRLDLHAGEVGDLGQIPDDEHVGRRGRAVREDAAERLQAAVEEEPLFGEGAGGRDGQERGEEGQEHAR